MHQAGIFAHDPLPSPASESRAPSPTFMKISPNSPHTVKSGDYSAPSACLLFAASARTCGLRTHDQAAKKPFHDLGQRILSYDSDGWRWHDTDT